MKPRPSYPDPSLTERTPKAARSMRCSTCVAASFATDDQLRRLVAWQAIQLDRLTGGSYELPSFDGPGLPERGAAVSDAGVIDGPGLSLPAVVAALDADGIFRKPGRVAAPRLIKHLANAGWTLTRTT